MSTHVEPLTVICAPSRGTLESEQVAGSIELNCERCAQTIWCSPTGQKQIIERYEEGALLEVLCAPCGLRAIEEDPEPHVLPISEEQADEILEALRRHS